MTLRTSPADIGFSLVEVTVALGIAAFALLAIFGLLPIAAQTNSNATSQTAAANILSAVTADIRATPKTATASPQFGVDVGTNATLYFDAAARANTSLQTDSRYQLKISFSTSPTGMVYANLRLTWPAGASSDKAAGAIESLAAFNRN